MYPRSLSARRRRRRGCLHRVRRRKRGTPSAQDQRDLLTRAAPHCLGCRPWRTRATGRQHRVKDEATCTSRVRQLVVVLEPASGCARRDTGRCATPRRWHHSSMASTIPSPPAAPEPGRPSVELDACLRLRGVSTVIAWGEAPSPRTEHQESSRTTRDSSARWRGRAAARACAPPAGAARRAGSEAGGVIAGIQGRLDWSLPRFPFDC